MIRQIVESLIREVIPSTPVHLVKKYIELVSISDQICTNTSEFPQTCLNRFNESTNRRFDQFCQGARFPRIPDPPTDPLKYEDRALFSFLKKHRWGLLVIAGLLLVGIALGDRLLQWLTYVYDLLADRERISALIRFFGPGAPLVFMALQILQVLLAPVPGEMTGFLGGFLFGAIQGFFYSTIALSLGSMLNFGIGRLLGERYVRSWIPADKFVRYDRLLRQRGLLVIFSLFVFPGFPKDWLCLFLGLSTLPLRVFVFLATVGRMPGTLLLSLQGHYLFEQNYLLLGSLLILSLLVVAAAVYYRDRLYEWAQQIDTAPFTNGGPPVDGTPSEDGAPANTDETTSNDR